MSLFETRSLRALSIAALLTLSTAAGASAWTADRLLEFTEASCSGWVTTSAPAAGYASASITSSDLRFGEIVAGRRFRVPVDDNALVELDVVVRASRALRFIGSLFDKFGDPQVLVSLASDCSLQAARQLEYSTQGQALYIVSLDADLQPKGMPDWLNPPLEFGERPVAAPLKHRGDVTSIRMGSIRVDPVRVGMVDSGVNYRLPEINRRLARTDDGKLIGYDFWEMDDLPYDSHPVNTGFFVQRHGTRSASLLLREAPGIELVPYRYPRPDMSRMQALVEHASNHRVDILGMPLGSNRVEDWGSFARAAKAHPRMLFIVSAGNNGRDIDSDPVFPASLDLDNMLVVTSAGDFVVPAEGVNWGSYSVDYLVPAERRAALDYSGNEALVSGSSYAVSRVVALAARLKREHRDWGAAQLIDAMRQRYGRNSPDVSGWVSSGYIADPIAGDPIQKSVIGDLDLDLPSASSGLRLDLDFLLLDPQWSIEEVRAAMQQAFRILAQCDVVAGDVTGFAIRADDYLLDLSTGSARSLLESVAAQQPTLVFARATRMREAYLGEAFGYGNTRHRPWLRNSVWLMRDVDDAGIALAHELYHVLANNGDHVRGRPNLMQPDTRPESTELTPLQCRLAQNAGIENGLLSRF
jgi:hypothetical protein